MSTRTVGEFTITAVSDGLLTSPPEVVLGVSREDLVALTGVPPGQNLPLDVNCFLIRDNGKLMLSDVGSGNGMGPNLGKLPQNLRAIGVEPKDIDIILLTHLHPDHSLGLLDADGKAVYPNAEIFVHEIEAAFWLDRTPRDNDSERVTRNTKAQRVVTAPYRDRIRRVTDGEVLPGITAILRAGHTPGHTNWLLQSNGERFLMWGDIVHLAAVQVPRPEAALVFDVDPEMAKASRAAAFEWVARERVVVGGAHLGYPGFGTLERAGQGYAFRPEV